MGNKLTSKVILEGTQLTFRTESAFELNEHPYIVERVADWMVQTGGLYMPN